MLVTLLLWLNVLCHTLLRRPVYVIVWLFNAKVTEKHRFRPNTIVM